MGNDEIRMTNVEEEATPVFPSSFGFRHSTFPPAIAFKDLPMTSVSPRWLWTATVLGATALAGCSSTKLALTGDKTPALPKLPKGPDVSVTSVPGSPDVSVPKDLKHPDRVHLAYARWQEQQRQPALAREAYQKALDHDPKSAEALLGLARIDQLGGRPSEAEQHLAKAQQLHPNSPLVLAGWGEFYTSQHNWPRAIERYRQAIQLAPDEALYKHQLAVALVKSGAVNEGLAQFTIIVGPAEGHYNVAVLLNQMGRKTEAEQHVQQALALKPELSPATKLMVQLRRDKDMSPPVAAAPVAPPVAPVAPPVQVAETPPTPAQPVIPAAWTAAKPTSSVQPATYASPQAEQWRNQQTTH
jgi:tetratricopeptide (TPR) repeat protein